MTVHMRTSTANVAHEMYKLYRTTDAAALSAEHLQSYGAHLLQPRYLCGQVTAQHCEYLLLFACQHCCVCGN